MHTNTQAQPTYFNNSCSSSTFAANSSFQSDLNNLHSSLASNNTANADFFNTTVRGGGNTLYGLFMCRSDVTLQLCHQCVVDSTDNYTFPVQRLEEGRDLVRGVHDSIFRPLLLFYRTSPDRCGTNPNSVANNQTGCMNVLSTTINEAANPALGQKKFATSLQFQTMYRLVQCTPDLSPQDCRICLRDAITELLNCSDRSIGGSVLYPSCNVRYELFIFYDFSGQPVSTPPPALSPVTRQGRARTIVIVVVYVGGAAILFSLVFFLLRSLIKKRRRAELRQNTLEMKARL